MTYVGKFQMHRDQRWQRAQARWNELGFHSKVFYKACRLMDEAIAKGGEKLAPGDAYLLARDFVEKEEAEQKKQQELSVK